MSVVNKMLQDLETRENDAANIPADYQPPQKKSVSRVVWGALVLVALLAVGFWLSPSFSSKAPVVRVPKTIETSGPAVTQDSQQAASDNASKDVELKQGPSESAVEPAIQAASVSEEFEEENLTAEQVDVAAQETPEEMQQDATSQNSQEPNSSFSVVSSEQQQDRGSLREQAQAAIKSGDNQEAIGLLYELLEEAPDNVGARKKLSALLFGQGQLGAAKQILTDGVNRSPDNVQLRLMLARLLYQQNDNQGAFEQLNVDGVSAFLYPDFVSFRASLADKLQRFDVARKDYQQLVENQPSESRWWLGYAVSLERSGENALALQAYNQTYKLGQLSPEVMQFVQQRMTYLAGAQ